MLDGGIKEYSTAGSDLIEPTSQETKARPVLIVDMLPAPSSPVGAVGDKYRGFSRTLRCLAIRQLVARPIDDGDVRYS
jgi:hypothetical protein